MEILKLSIKNFLSITDVEVTPGKVNQVVGGNNAGKTTVIRAIEFAAKGSADGSLVRNGADAAEVIMELSDNTTVRRRISAEGKQTVSVKRDGFLAPSPQSYLDELFEQSAFNPLDLLDPKRRVDAIMRSIDLKVDAAELAHELACLKEDLPPLDYSQHGIKVLDQAHRYFYQRRAEANKDVAEKKKRFEVHKEGLPKETPPKLDRSEIQKQIDAIALDREKVQREITRIRGTFASAKAAQDRLDKYCAAVDAIDDDIAKQEKYLETLKARRGEGQKFVDQARAEVPENLESDATSVQKLNDLNVEAEKAKAKFAEVDRAEAVSKQSEMVAGLEREYESARVAAEILDAKVYLLSGPAKKKLMAQVEMPVQGLEYHDGTFLVGGIPVDNLSTSYALKLAVAVARKLAKKTKLICIDGCEALDEKSYEILRQEIEGDGYTYFLTVVGEGFTAPKDRVIEMKQGMAEVRQ